MSARVRGAVADLVMGARMVVTGGRDGWTRAALTALGVGIGVALLLLAAAVPGALQARQARGDARDDLRVGTPIAAAADTLLVLNADTEFRGSPIRGRLLRPEGPAAPVPPGLTTLPGPGEVAVSPALRDLLNSPAGALLAPRLGGARVTGTIAHAGLAGPDELAYYRGSDTLTDDRATRLDTFGGGIPGEGFGPVLMLLVSIIFVVLLLPIAVFLAAAVRFGGERRDRRLAALRLVGADSAMVRRIAAGEAAAGALLGVAVGGLLFAAGRQVVPLVTLWDLSVYASDVRPPLPLVAVVVATVPVLATLVALVALRSVLIEPLGVTRRGAPVRRRLWWRLLLPAAGLVLLLRVSGLRSAVEVSRWQAPAGAVLLLVGTVTLLPWLTERLVARLRGGTVAWQLAVRRMQLDTATSARLVAGIAVAVAGTIGLQMLFAGVSRDYVTDTGQDPARAQVQVQLDPVPDGVRRLAATPGVAGVDGTLLTVGTVDGPSATPAVQIRVGDCAALAQFARLESCADGDAFRVPEPEGPPAAVPPGTGLIVDATRWRVPAGTREAPARPSPAGWTEGGLLLTPRAATGLSSVPMRTDAFVRLDPAGPDAIEHVRNTVAALSPTAYVSVLTATREDRKFTSIRRGLYVGATVTLLLIAVSMLVGTLEQLRERRRLLAMLVAVGTRRATLGWSVLWQTALPVLVGLALAVVFGLGLGAALLRMTQTPIAVAWSVLGLSVALGAVVVLLVTAASLPVLWRLTRPDGLRTE
ncbi:FtsX-like permease family protein [Micromonospora sp. NPDC000089]|uniref:FtsX-like permease family protein n=1 Tax=unclassified Micromonospora TaxID=2617518 RepID=UPI00368A8EB0